MAINLSFQKRDEDVNKTIYQTMTVGLTNTFNLFSTLPIQNLLSKVLAWMEVRPTNSVEDGTPVDFEISGSGMEYFDLANTFIKSNV